MTRSALRIALLATLVVLSVVAVGWVVLFILFDVGGGEVGP